MQRLILTLSLTSFVFGLTGCGDFSQTIRQTALTLTADRTTTPTGQTVSFRYDAQGRSLAGLVVDFGDGSRPDSLSLGGAVTATGTRVHTFTQAGSFIVTGRLEEFFLPPVETEIPITVTSPE
jgi:hypothetical protein